jgi:hypothetical protein
MTCQRVSRYQQVLQLAPIMSTMLLSAAYVLSTVEQTLGLQLDLSLETAML